MRFDLTRWNQVLIIYSKHSRWRGEALIGSRQSSTWRLRAYKTSRYKGHSRGSSATMLAIEHEYEVGAYDSVRFRIYLIAIMAMF